MEETFSLRAEPRDCRSLQAFWPCLTGPWRRRQQARAPPCVRFIDSVDAHGPWTVDRGPWTMDDRGSAMRMRSNAARVDGGRHGPCQPQRQPGGIVVLPPRDWSVFH